MDEDYKHGVKTFEHIIDQVINNTAPRIIKLRISYFDDHILIAYWLFNVCFNHNEEHIKRFISENSILSMTLQQSIRMDMKEYSEYKNWFTLGSVWA